MLTAAGTGQGGGAAPGARGDTASRAGAAGASDLGFAPGCVLGGVSLGLRGQVVGRRVHYLVTVGSTNVALRELAESGEPEGTVVLADEQTAGKGRVGRSWHSPPRLGLWFSVLLRPRRPRAELGALSIVTAVSVAAALRDDPGVEAGVKWPNDIVAEGQKLGGILLESRQGASGTADRGTAQTAGGPTRGPAGAVVVGIGLNVNQTPADFPADLAGTAVSLRMLLGRQVPRLGTLRGILTRLEEDRRLFELEGPSAFRDRWLGLSTTLGRRVVAESGSEVIRGVAVDLSPAGALVVETEGGGRREIWAGDVVAQGGPDG